MLASIFAVCLGASCGALLRWFFGLQLNGLFPTLPLGTLVANLLGGYGVGVATAFFINNPGIAPEWRLLVITGFLGGFTTFSTFSVETIDLLQQGRGGWALATVALHLLGSLAMTAAGLATINLLSAD